MFEAQFGISLDDYVDQLGDPSAFVRMKNDLDGVFGSPCRWTAPQVLYAATLFSRTGDTTHLTLEAMATTDPDYNCVSDSFKHSKQSALIAGGDPTLPVVLDSGASKSLTPNLNDFITPLRDCTVSELQGLGGKSAVVGIGMVEWTIRDLYGKTGKIRTEAYYVPAAQIRLLSPQTYFQELAAQGQRYGYLRMDSKLVTMEISSGDVLTFPYQCNCNLPFMLPSLGDSHTEVGLEALSDIDISLCFTTVVDETNQNLTPSQRELLQLHQRLGHCKMRRIQHLCGKPSDPSLQVSQLKTKNPGVSTCTPPICAACQFSKSRKRPVRQRLHRNLRPPSNHQRQLHPTQETDPVDIDHLQPGTVVSTDQFHSTVRGRNRHTSGRERNTEKFVGGTIFVDQASGFIYAKPQITLRSGDTIRTKAGFERFCHSVGVKVHRYQADNHPFASNEFRNSLQPGQNLTFSGVGAHHQNGAAENAVKTVTTWARSLLLHAALHWPEQVNLELWPFALEHAVWLWNHVPRDDHSRLAPIEIFTGTKLPTDLSHLHRLHVWGCPTYVLDPKLQDGKKVPKWSKRARLGMFLGFSEEHSTTVGLILNPQTGRISPQFHCVFDDWFSTVAAPLGNDFEAAFDADSWARLIESGLERVEFDDTDASGRPLPVPQLHDEWLTDAERTARDHHQRSIDTSTRTRRNEWIQ